MGKSVAMQYDKGQNIFHVTKIEPGTEAMKIDSESQ